MKGVSIVEREQQCHKLRQSLEYAPLECHDDEHEAVDQLLCECFTHSFLLLPTFLLLLACIKIH